jgi:hypothetical protein
MPVDYTALAKLGAILVPVNFWYRADDIRYPREQSDSQCLIAHEHFRSVVESVALDGVTLAEDDPHIILRHSQRSLTHRTFTSSMTVT